jgi:hypothetical protein
VNRTTCGTDRFYRSMEAKFSLYIQRISGEGVGEIDR